ncbi:MAG TPA: hypothetical protein VJ036_04315, partial [bacterium]|nr:hypothetical protein [bacterium]
SPAFSFLLGPFDQKHQFHHDPKRGCFPFFDPLDMALSCKTLATHDLDDIGFILITDGSVSANKKPPAIIPAVSRSLSEIRFEGGVLSISH